jgi:Ser-tRNA(Ala) deacylase AlaX
LPLSAAEFGTKKLYLDNYELLECDAHVASSEDLSEGAYRLELDQTCMYPGGGGQDCDLGRIEWDGGRLDVSEVSKDNSSGLIWYDGTLEGNPPEANAVVHVVVDKERRLLNSRLHCAGHLIDYALEQLGKKWQAGKGSHRPGACYVEYSGDEFNPEETEDLARGIEKILADVAQKGGPIKPMRVPSAAAHKYSAYLPQHILDSYQNVHVTSYPNNFYVCCGGTHLTDVSQLSEVKVTKIKKKGKAIRVSYEVEA